MNGIKFVSQLCCGVLCEKRDLDKLCRNEEQEKAKLNKIHKKDLYFTGDVEVGAILEFNKEDIACKISENLKTMLKNDINTIDISYIFSFSDMEYKKTAINIKFNDTIIKVEYIFDFEKRQGYKIIKVNETETKNDLHKDVFKLITDCAQDVLYYDDFMYKKMVSKQFGFNRENNQDLF